MEKIGGREKMRPRFLATLHTRQTTMHKAKLCQGRTCARHSGGGGDGEDVGAVGGDARCRRRLAALARFFRGVEGKARLVGKILQPTALLRRRHVRRRPAPRPTLTNMTSHPRLQTKRLFRVGVSGRRIRRRRNDHRQVSPFFCPSPMCDWASSTPFCRTLHHGVVHHALLTRGSRVGLMPITSAQPTTLQRRPPALLSKPIAATGF